MNNATMSCGLLSVDLDTRSVYVKGRPLALRNKEFLLMELFVRNVGKVLSRTDILEYVWDRNWCCQTNTVDVHVWSLRTKLKSHFEDECIKTVHCVGYIFEI